MRKALFITVLAVLASGCATYGFPGFEAAGVVAGNQALVNALGVQAQSALQPGGYAIAGVGNVPICRLQDLAGLPAVNQPVLVRVGKGKSHRMADIVGGAAIAGGLVYLSTGDAVAAGAGAGAGAGGGLLFSNHEQELCLFMPVARP